MRIGTALLVIAVGAILRWAVTVHTDGVDLETIGVILMVVGVVGLVLTLALIALEDRGGRDPRDVL